MSSAEINQLLNRGTVDVIVRSDLEKKLASGKKLRIKLGIDPTSPDLHLGHSVVLFKLRQFQEAGHQIVLLIGGFTATIGDPTGRNEARLPLSFEEIDANGKDYMKQAGKILDMQKVELVNNRDWLATMKPEDFIKLMAQFTTAQMLERDMFQERIKKEEPIFCHEILYPMLQGYDSVPIKADVETGGTDQLFNLLAGRPIQKAHGLPEQNILTVPLLEGLDGVEKMSKSKGNYIGLDDEPNEMFGKVMSMPDELMLKYFELVTFEDLDKMKTLVKEDPRGAKEHLGKVLVTFFHDGKAAENAVKDFETKFVKKETPDQMPEFQVGEAEVGILDLLSSVTKFAASNSEARRLVQQGAVSLDGEKITDPNQMIRVTDGMVIKCGKRKFGKLKK